MLTPGLQKTIEAAGINVSALDAIRFTPGVLGKASFVAAAAVFSIVAVAVVSRDFWVFLARGDHDSSHFHSIFFW